MPQLFQLKGSDYGAVPNGPAVAIIFQESDKAQKVVGRYLITFSIPSVTMQPVQHEVAITDGQYFAMKSAGFRAVELALQPDTGADALRNDYERWYRRQQQAERDHDEEMWDIAAAKLARIIREAASLGYDTSMWPGANLVKR